jgi:hypothetical protein
MPNLVSNGGFTIYPRGFLGAILAPQIEKQPAPFESEYRKLQNNLNLFQSSPGQISTNGNVESLYSKYIRNTYKAASFDFQKLVLITALSAFGTDAFDFWYLKQLESPSVGDLHRRFLDDCLNFITTGRREMDLTTWDSLLDYSDSGEMRTGVSEVAAEFFGITTNGQVRQRRNTMLVEVLQEWCSRPNGLEDLLCSLHVLFGTRS